MAKVGVGIVGTGWGELQVEAFRHVRGALVVGLCDADAGHAGELARRYKIGRSTGDYQELLADDSIALISIVSPPDLHESMVRSAIQAGKHVLCEKPLGLSVCAAKDLLAEAEAKGIVHAMDFEMRHLPAVAYSKELIEEGYLGRLLRVDVTMATEKPWGVHGNWAADGSRGGGILMELGAHFIDLLTWWFGDVISLAAGRRTNFPELRIPKLKPDRGNGYENRTVTGDDAFWCHLEFQAGGEGLVSFVTGARHDPGWNIAAVGQVGTLIVSGGQLLGMREGDREMAILPIPKRLELGDSPRDPLMWSMAKLFERVVAKIGGESAPGAFPDFGDAVANLKLVECIRSSSDELRRVKPE